jgi:signal transduction histidine kinase
VSRFASYRVGVNTIEAPWRTHGGPPVSVRRFVLPFLVGVLQIIGTFSAARFQPGRRSLDLLAVILLVLGPAALNFRRRYPIGVLAFTLAVTAIYWVLDYPRGPVFVSMIVAFFAAQMAKQRIAAILSLVIGYFSFVWLPYLVGKEPAPDWEKVLGAAAWLLVLFTISEIARSRRERAIEYERTRAEETKRRASEERLRIARELHDVLAHNISLISVQAGVALHLMDDRPEQAATALKAIKKTSDEALGELRSVLDVLRQGNEQPPRTPPSGLANLDDLFLGTEAAGLRVTKVVEGSQLPLSGEVDLAAYRIVQEALTNVTRHAKSAHATVTLTYGDNDLTIQIDDDGAGSSDVIPGGKGIAGMSERAAALGGSFAAGPRSEGGFRVVARLPLEPHHNRERA